MAACAVGSAASVPAEAALRNGLIAFTTVLSNDCEGLIRECDGAIRFIRPDGTGRRRFACSGKASECAETRPRFSPSGRLVATSNDAYPGGAALTIRRLDGSPIRSIKLPDPESGAYDMAWSPDGSRLAVNDYERVLLVRSAGGTPRLYRKTGGLDVAWSRQGRLAWTHYYRRGLWISDPTTQRVRRLPVNVGSPLRWSPDGRRLVTEGLNGALIIRSDGSLVRQLKRCDLLDTTPAWSPDGRHIACATSDLHLIVITLNPRRVRVIARGVYPVDIDWQRLPRSK
jgi:Tol biopolymer transport system component